MKLFCDTVVFSTDENYVMPTSVAIFSLISNMPKDTTLSIYIMTEKKLSKTAEKILEKSLSNSSSKINYLYVGDWFNDNKLHIEHISKATYYRLLLPKLLKNVKQCIYLDGDICINNDIQKLFQIKLKNDEYIAGVKAPGIQLKRRGKKERMKILGIESLDNYINAGVIIINLDAIRNNNLFDKMIELSKLDLPVQDQDVLNVSCYNHIRILSPIYNSMPHLFYYRKKRLSKLYSLNEIDEAICNPIIIHYADKYKPWKYYNVNNSDKWYYYYEELYNDKLKNLKNAKIEKKLDYFKKKIDMITKK